MRGLLTGEYVEVKEKTGIDLVKSANDLVKKAMDGRDASEKYSARAGVDHPSLGHAYGHLWNVLTELAPDWIREQTDKANKAQERKAKRDAKAQAKLAHTSDDGVSYENDGE